MNDSLPNRTQWLAKGLEILLHLLFWASVFLLMFWFFGARREMVCVIDGEEVVTVYREKESLQFLFVGILVKACFCYWNVYWLLPSFIPKRQYRQYFLQALALVFLGIGIELTIVNYFIYTEVDFRFLVRSSLIGFGVVSWFFYWGISALYGLIKQWQQHEKQRKLLMQEKLKTELDFLKFQINPHFLFNTLNNLFSIAQKHKVSELEEGISGLASLMRYMVYESNVEQVRLTTEVKYLQAFIEMQQLQFDEADDIIINFKTKGELVGKYIAPMLLIPFVENAFKHGVDISRNSIIQINLTVEDFELKFQVGNTCHHVSPDLEHQRKGIGLANVKRRLELLYPEKHKLSIEQKDGFFECMLILPLSKGIAPAETQRKEMTEI